VVPEIEEPFEFDNALRLDRLPDWLCEESFLEELSSWRRADIDGSAEYALIVEYNARSLSEADPEWADIAPMDVKAGAVQRMRIASLALWVAKPSGVGFHWVAHARWSDGEWVREDSDAYFPQAVPVCYANAIATHGHIEESVEIYTKLRSLHRSGPAWRCASTLWSALGIAENEARYLLLWAALEALFGPSGGAELQHRVSERIAWFLKGSRPDAHATYLATKAAYDFRSKTVHGTPFGSLMKKVSSDEAWQHEEHSLGVLRDSLRRVLLDAELTELFSGGDKDAYLDGLAFAR
jgi:hypothetical protein